MFTVEMLPAGHGDALWLEYGEGDRRSRVLVDGGTGPTYDVLRSRIASLPPDDRRLELLVITHIDADHIEGVIRLLQDVRLGLRIDDVWFNGWQHLPGDVFAPTHGEMLSALLVDLDQRWNGAFDGGPVSVADDDGPLPVF
jgi:glyoxylase-like metal-dependent hydrolase (beta-lactamase superfamily II)